MLIRYLRALEREKGAILLLYHTFDILARHDTILVYDGGKMIKVNFTAEIDE